MDHNGVSQIDAYAGGVVDRLNHWRNDREYREDMLGREFVNTKAGLAITHRNAVHYSAVWRAVSMISGDIAKLPLHLFRRFPDDTLERPRDHPHYRIFSRRPNDFENQYDFWRRRMVEILIWGHAFVLLVRRRDGEIVEAVPLCPDRTEVVGDPEDVRAVQTYVDGKEYTIPWDNCLVLQWLSLDRMNAIDVTRAARETWAAGLGAVGLTARAVGRGGRLGGILELPAGLSNAAKDKIEEGFRRSYETIDSAFSSVVLRENAKFHDAQQTFQALQLVEGRRESVRDVARFYGMAPSRLAEESGSTYNSKAEDNRDYLDTTLSPFLCMITAELNRKTLSEQESWPTNPRAPEHYWEHNTSAMLRMDTEARYRTYGVGIQYGIISPNEARRMENMNPREGGDEYGNPNTTPGPPQSNSDSRQALASLVVSSATKFARGVFDRFARRAKPDFIEAADRRRSLFLRSIAKPLKALEKELSCAIRADVAEAYTQAIESKLPWVLENVPATLIRKELPDIAAEATKALEARIWEIEGAL